jgi:multidrug efflux pump
VIPQVQRVSRLNVEQLLDYPIANAGGVPVPLSTIAHIRTETVPETLNHFQQLNAATLSGVASPGLSEAETLDYLRSVAARTLPSGYTIDYAGPSRQFVQESSGVLGTFGFAIVIAFLTLAALYESFRDPLVILISVPLSILGALIFIALGVRGASLNIYTQVGLVTLIGLISKHGILIVEVANEEQRSGKSKRDAIVSAASVRLRPILMTTAAMVLGVMPLVFAVRGARGIPAHRRHPRTHRARARDIIRPGFAGPRSLLEHEILLFSRLAFLYQALSRKVLSPAFGNACKPPVKTLTRSALRFIDCLVYSTRRMLI